MISTPDNNIRLIRRKKKKNIIHEIYRYDQTLIKRFIKTAPFPDTRKVWKLEDTALRKLTELPVPVTYGFIEKKFNGAREIIYAREFIEGTPVKEFTYEDITSMAEIMAQIHKNGVFTRDPLPDNFIKTHIGKILFVDFGRSVLLNPKNPATMYYLGKELARIRLYALFGNDVLYEKFLDVYFDAFQTGPIKRKVVEHVSSLWYKRLLMEQIRKKQRGPKIKD